MKKKFRIRKKVLWGWVISYITIMVIPVIFGMGIYLYALHTTRKAVQTIHENSILQVKETFNGTLNDLRRVSYTMASTADKAGISYREFSRNSDYPQNAAQLQKTISSYRIANDAIEEVYLYFPNNDYILTSSVTYKYGAIADQTKRFMGLAGEEFQEACQAPEESTLYVTNEKDGKPKLYYIYKGSEFRGRVIALIPLNMEAVGNMMQTKSTEYYLKAGDSLVFISGGQEREAGELPVFLLESGQQAGSVNFQDTLWTGIRGESYDYSILAGIEGSAYLREINTMKLLLLFYLMVSAVLGALATWYFSRRNYQPVSKLLASTGQDYQDGLNEFQVISDYYASVMEKYRTASKELREGRDDIYSSRFSRLIRNVDNAFLDWQWKEIREDGEVFLAGPYVMAGIQIEYTDHDFQLNQFVVDNMFGELLGSKYEAISGEVDGFLIFLIHLPDDQLGEAEIVKDIERAVYNIEHFSHMKLTVNLSRITDNIRMTGCCLDEIKSLQEYRDWMKKDSQKVRTANELFFPGEEAYEYVKNYRKCTQMQQLIREGQFEQVQEILQSILAAEGAGASRKAVKKEQMVEEITDYIENHFDDWQLSGKMFAKRYQVSLSYLSQIFKKEKGIGLLDYMNQIRYRKAKEMIDQGITIQEAAQRVGYTTTQPLRRLFRQFEGITPSQSRKKEG